MASLLMPSDVLLVGCGDLGADIGQRLAAAGHDVLALRRRAELVPAPLHGLGVDLTSETPTLPPLDLSYLVVALTARPRTEDAYRATYVDGMRRALDAIDTAGQRPDRAVLVSSTGVFGAVPEDELIDERTTPGPADGPATVLLEAEELFSERFPHGTILRLSGLYGRDEKRLVDRGATRRESDPHRWTNRIHRADASAAVVHLLTMPQTPDRLYVGTDDEPALLGEVAAHLAARDGLPLPPAPDPALAHGKRLSNARLRATGWTPQYPTFRDGYAN